MRSSSLNIALHCTRLCPLFVCIQMYKCTKHEDRISKRPKLFFISFRVHEAWKASAQTFCSTRLSRFFSLLLLLPDVYFLCSSLGFFFFIFLILYIWLVTKHVCVCVRQRCGGFFFILLRLRVVQRAN